MEQKGLNGNQLKVIAIIAMTLDHFTDVLFPGYPTEWYFLAIHLLGRLTAPIMWFFVAEGYHYTRDWKKYLGRLLGFAFLSHFAYNFAFGISFVPFRASVFNQTSVLWALALGLLALAISDGKFHWLQKQWQRALGVMGCCVLAFPANWSSPAVMAIVSMGSNRGNFKRQMAGMLLWAGVYALVYFLFIDRVYGILQLGVALTIPLLARYNGERGTCKWLPKFFYFYYPAHLFLCGLLRLALWGDVGVLVGA